MNLRVNFADTAVSYDPSRAAEGGHFEYLFILLYPPISAGLRQNKQKRDRNLLAHLVPNLFSPFCMMPQISDAFFTEAC